MSNALTVLQLVLVLGFFVAVGCSARRIWRANAWYTALGLSLAIPVVGLLAGRAWWEVVGWPVCTVLCFVGVYFGRRLDALDG
jgi:hypothetical protein